MRPARLSSTVILSAAIAVCLAAAQPVTRAQSGRAGDHWVGTWATAVVSRLPVPPSPAQAPDRSGAVQGPLTDRT